MEMMEVSPLQCVSRPVHLADIPADDAMFVSMRNFIGRGQLMTYDYTHEEVRVNEEVVCGEDDDSVVFYVCPTDRDTRVSFESSYKDKEPCVKICSTSGEVTSDTDLKDSISYRFETDDFSYVYTKFSDAEGKTTYAKHTADTDKHYSLRTKSNVYSGNVSTVPKKGNTKSTGLFSINCGPHRAFDENRSADLFAVVEEARGPAQDRSRQVKLFRRSQTDPTATYQSPVTPCQPADVCFFTLGGQEVLLIADELNDAIHVVEVKDNGSTLTFSRYLAPGCPLLVQPTALNIDLKGRLWVGCRGGRLLTVEALPQDAAAASAGATASAAGSGGIQLKK
ncbi:hypothetical protein ACOMHN_065834 [Nucella lapillus]